MHSLMKFQDIFTELHSYFTWILKEGASHFTERSLEGPSLNFDNNVIDIGKFVNSVLINFKANVKFKDLSTEMAMLNF